MIFYGKSGEFATNRRDQQELGMVALHILQAAIVYVNTLMVQEVLALPEWKGVLTTDDKRGLTPLFLEPHSALRGSETEHDPTTRPQQSHAPDPDQKTPQLPTRHPYLSVGASFLNGGPTCANRGTERVHRSTEPLATALHRPCPRNTPARAVPHGPTTWRPPRSTTRRRALLLFHLASALSISRLGRLVTPKTSDQEGISDGCATYTTPDS